MRFGEVRVDEAEGAILAHSLRAGRTMLRKGRRLSADDLMLLAEAGIARVTVARLEPDDVDENETAHRIAGALAGANVHPATPANGRADLYAEQGGLLVVDAASINALNEITEAVTLATLAGLAPVKAGERVATVKIIPFGVPFGTVGHCLGAAAKARMSIRPFRPLTARLVQSQHEGLKPSVVDKTSTVTAERMAHIGGTLAGESRSAHTIESVADAMAAELAARPDVLLVIGASAIVDRRDVIPSAIERLGGRVERLGMPVEPGNLILVGDVGGTPVLGLPGCARSPVRNGLDWVLERIAAGVPVGRADIGRMGVGGLLVGGDDDKDYL